MVFLKYPSKTGNTTDTVGFFFGKIYFNLTTYRKMHIDMRSLKESFIDNSRDEGVENKMAIQSIFDHLNGWNKSVLIINDTEYNIIGMLFKSQTLIFWNIYFKLLICKRYQTLHIDKLMYYIPHSSML